MVENQPDGAFEIHEVYDDPADVVGEYTDRRARLIGKVLVACFLCPLMMYTVLGGGSTMLFFWDFLGTKDASLVTWTLIPLVAGLAALLGRKWFSGSSLCATLFLTGVTGLGVLSFLDLSDTGMLLGSALTVDAGWMFLVFLLSVMTIAIGNRLRKQMPHVKLPHFLMGAGGLLFTAFSFFPAIDGDTAVSFLFSSRAWSVDAFGNVLLLVVLAYGVTSALAPLRLPALDWTRTGVVVVHRLILFGLPIGILLSRNADASGYEAAFTGGSTLNILFWALKVFALYYGLIALAVLGASGWLRLDLNRRLQAAEAASG